MVGLDAIEVNTGADALARSVEAIPDNRVPGFVQPVI